MVIIAGFVDLQVVVVATEAAKVSLQEIVIVVVAGAAISEATGIAGFVDQSFPVVILVEVAAAVVPSVPCFVAKIEGNSAEVVCVADASARGWMVAQFVAGTVSLAVKMQTDMSSYQLREYSVMTVNWQSVIVAAEAERKQLTAAHFDSSQKLLRCYLQQWEGILVNVAVVVVVAVFEVMEFETVIGFVMMVEMMMVDSAVGVVAVFAVVVADEEIADVTAVVEAAAVVVVAVESVVAAGLEGSEVTAEAAVVGAMKQGAEATGWLDFVGLLC